MWWGITLLDRGSERTSHKRKLLNWTWTTDKSLTDLGGGMLLAEGGAKYNGPKAEWTSGVQRTGGKSTRLERAWSKESARADGLRRRRVRQALAGHHESNGKLLEDCGKTTDTTQFEFLKVTLADKWKKWFGRRPKIGSWNTSQEAKIQSG